MPEFVSDEAEAFAAKAARKWLFLSVNSHVISHVSHLIRPVRANLAVNHLILSTGLDVKDSFHPKEIATMPSTPWKLPRVLILLPS